MGTRMYRSHQVSREECVKLLEEKGLPILKMVEYLGKHNTWIKEQLIAHYGRRIEFKQGRNGGIFVDGKKMTRD